MTSAIKSELGMPAVWTEAFGVPVSAAATAAVGRSADGRGGVGGAADVAATPGSVAAAVPASAMPAKNLRRFKRFCARARAMLASCPLSIQGCPHKAAAMLIQRRGRRQGEQGEDVLSAPEAEATR